MKVESLYMHGSFDIIHVCIYMYLSIVLPIVCAIVYGAELV